MTVVDDRPVVLAYDGSNDARQAIEAAGRVLTVRRAVVVHVYQPFVELLTGKDIELPKAIAADAAEASRLDREEAEATARQGAKIAIAAGFDATAVTVTGSLSVWPTILDFADEHDASAVVTGSRGLSGISRVLGSVSSGVIHHCRRPVMVVPAVDGQVDAQRPRSKRAEDGV